MNIETVSMHGIDYPIETITTEENGTFTTKFFCLFPNGVKKSLQVTYNSGTEENLLDNHKISLQMELQSMVLYEIRKELFQEIHDVKITDLWEKFCKVSLYPSELQEDMKTDVVFKKFVEEFYPDYVKGS